MSTLNVQAQFLGGHDRGNGGDVLVCYDSAGKITSAKFYDLFEAEVKFGLKLIAPQGNTLNEKVDSIISRVEKIDPSRAWAFRNWYKDFFQESKFIPGVELGDIPDQGDALWPVNCKIKQLVVQTDVKPPLNPHRYTFSQDLWNLLDDNSKVATIIHELIFREARIKGHRSSQAVRYLNGLFWADRLNQLTLPEYIKLITIDLKLAVVTTYQGIPFFSRDPYDYEKYYLAGLKFNIFEHEFMYSNASNLCGSLLESGICHNSGYLNSSLLRFKTPKFLNHANIDSVWIDYGKLRFQGQFSISYQNLNATVLKQTDFNSWLIEFYRVAHPISDYDLLSLKFKNDEVDTIEYQLRRSEFRILFVLNSTTQIKTKNNSIESISYIPGNDIDINTNFICKAGQKLEVENLEVENRATISCVLVKDVVFNRLNTDKTQLVKAGKRVLVNSNLALIKVQ